MDWEEDKNSVVFSVNFLCSLKQKKTSRGFSCQEIKRKQIEKGKTIGENTLQILNLYY